MLSFPVRASETEKLIALTFDDGPSGKFTRILLQGLEKRGAKATFFLCGYRMEQYPELTQQIFQEGHEIGLHGYSHKSMKNMCERDVLREFEKSMALVPAGCNVSFLRSPGGLCGNCVHTVAEKMNLSVLSWSVDPKDWSIHDAKAVKNHVLRQAQDGDIVLLHDMSDSSIDAALAIIDALQARGFRFVTVSDLAQARNISPVPGLKYTHFHPSQERK